MTKIMKIKSGRGYKKYYTKRFGNNIKVLKVAQNQLTGSEMALIAMSRSSSYYPTSWYVVYSSGDYGEYGSLASADAQFKKMSVGGELI